VLEEVLVTGRAQAFYLEKRTSVGSKLDLDVMDLPQSAQVLPEGFFGVSETIEVPEYDPEGAKDLLAEAGYPDGLTLEVQVPNTTVPLQLMQVIQSMAAEAGIEVEITSKEFATLLSDQSAGDYTASQIGWSGRVDPDGNIHQFVTTGGGINDSGYSNPEVDELLNAARTSNDLETRKQNYDAARDILDVDLPIVYLYHQTWIWALDAGIEGFTPYPDGMIRLEGVTMAE